MASTEPTLEVVMVAQISGSRYTDTGQKSENGTTIHEIMDWPAPGSKVRLPRAEALSLIHNELAYPATLKRRPRDRTEALLAAGAA